MVHFSTPLSSLVCRPLHGDTGLFERVQDVQAVVLDLLRKSSAFDSWLEASDGWHGAST